MGLTATRQLRLSPPTPTGPTAAVKLPRELTHRHLAEYAQKSLVSPAASLVLDLRKYERCEPTAEPHLMDWLTLVRRQGTPITLLVHTTSRRASRTMATRYEELFGDSLAGMLLAQLADRVTDENGSEQTRRVEELVRMARQSAGPTVRHGTQHAVLLAIDPRLPAIAPLAEPVKTLRTKAFQQFVLDELRALGFTSFEHVVRDIATCVEQAVENIRIHSGKLLPEGQSSSLGFLSLRRINSVEAKRLAKTSATPLREYWSSYSTKHLALTIADNGSGIAATMHGSRDIYDVEADHERELDEIRNALADGSSISSSGQGRGLGLPQILDAVAERDGLMIVRSGRLRAHVRRDPTHRDRPRIESVQQLTYPTGTTLAFVFPQPETRRSTR